MVLDPGIQNSNKTPIDNNITIPYYGYGQYRSVFNKSGIYTIAAIFMVQSTHNQNWYYVDEATSHNAQSPEHRTAEGTGS